MCLSQLRTDILNERTFDARDQFSDLFIMLLNTRVLPDAPSTQRCKQRGHCEAQKLQALANTYSNELSKLPRHSQYSRHVIGLDGAWLGFICRWEPHVRSPIHGHPCFAYYQVLQGDFTMDLYTVNNNGLAEKTDKKTLRKGDCIWQRGKAGCYDNFVHKISTHDEGGFTLHLFSENPSLGKHFNAPQSAQ